MKKPKVGAKDSIKIKIGIEDVLELAGAVSCTEASFSAMLAAAKIILTRNLASSYGNMYTFVGFTLLGVATTIVQRIFAQDIENLSDLYVEIDFEGYERTAINQGIEYKFPMWKTTDVDVYIA